MQKFISTIDDKGLVTIPAEIRKHLGVKDNDRVAFVIDNEGNVLIRVVRSTSIASLRGAAGSLKRPLSREQTRQIAYEDRLQAGNEKPG